jgi:aminoglycoside phosphotransferase (APT) family kinase protein
VHFLATPAAARQWLRQHPEGTVLDLAAALAAAEEIVAHGDLGPHNIVFHGDTAVAIIDWDEAVAPGSRLVDFADAVWSCADVCEPDIPVAEQACKVRLMCDAYGWDEIADRFQRTRNHHAAHQRLKPSPSSTR